MEALSRRRTGSFKGIEKVVNQKKVVNKVKMGGKTLGRVNSM